MPCTVSTSKLLLLVTESSASLHTVTHELMHQKPSKFAKACCKMQSKNEVVTSGLVLLIRFLSPCISRAVTM